MRMLESNPMSTRVWILLLLLSITVALPVAAQGNKKLMSITAAKADAQRCILESVTGLKVKSESVLRDMVAERFTIDAKTSGVVRDIEFTDIVYDPEKDIAKAVAQIKVGRVINIIGRDIDYGDAVIERTGFGTSTPANAPALQALRAAQIHAYQRLAEELTGVHIDSTTTVENFVLQHDDVKTQVLAAIWGARVKEYSWDRDGDAYVTMSLRANYLKDLLGNRFRGEQPEIQVEGMGTSNGTFGEASTGGSVGSSGREATLSIPVMGGSPADTGGASAP